MFYATRVSWSGWSTIELKGTRDVSFRYRLSALKNGKQRKRFDIKRRFWIFSTGREKGIEGNNPESVSEKGDEAFLSLMRIYQGMVGGLAGWLAGLMA